MRAVAPKGRKRKDNAASKTIGETPLDKTLYYVFIL
jgi:hypothetical protein